MRHPIPDVEPYPSEWPVLEEAGRKLEARFKGKRFDEDTMVAFMEAARDIFGEIGWLVGVDWYDARVTGVEVENAPSTGMTIPRVVIQGRVHAQEETDHERLQHEVVTGLADGVAGYVREDGSKHEDPIKRIIT